MAASAQITATTTPQLVHACTSGTTILWVHTSATMYFGGDNTVSSSTGFRLDANDKYAMQVAEGNEVWVVAASGSQKLYIFTETI